MLGLARSLNTRLAWVIYTLAVEVAIVALGSLALLVANSPIVGAQDSFLASYFVITQSTYDLTGSQTLSHLAAAGLYCVRYTAMFALGMFGLR